MVQDTGFNSNTNRRILQGWGHYIIGEKLRLGPKGKLHDALKQKGNTAPWTMVWRSKNRSWRRQWSPPALYYYQKPQGSHSRPKKREDILRDVERKLQELKQLDGEPHEKAACALRSHKVFGRYIRQTKTGKLKLNKAKISTEAQLDGKYLVSTSDDGLSAEDVVLGYKQLAAIERVFRDLKHLIDIRPVNHRLADRIRAHVPLCWLAMLLIRVTENEVQQTWFQLKKNTFHYPGILKLPGKVHQSNS